MTHPISETVIEKRRRTVIETAKAAGLLAGPKNPLGARVPQHLLKAAKTKSGISSNTDLVEYALAKVALEDDFGAWLVARKGSISPDLDLDF